MLEGSAIYANKVAQHVFVGLYVLYTCITTLVLGTSNLGRWNKNIQDQKEKLFNMDTIGLAGKKRQAAIVGVL